MDLFEARVKTIRKETDLIRYIELEPTIEVPISWTPGAHIRVSLPNGGDRAYSLMRSLQDQDNHLAIGVLLEDKSSGGSIYMHSLKEGDIVRFSGPQNHFPLSVVNSKIILIAGGIGITPILSMASELAKTGHEYELHYSGREAGKMAFIATLQKICNGSLYLHYDNEQNTRLDLMEILSSCRNDEQIYICGPGGMIEAAKMLAAQLGIDATRLHYELFTITPVITKNIPFEIKLSSNGQTIQVGAAESIIDALEAEGIDVIYDCKRGDCGICRCDVIDGVPDHRDIVLSDEEKASNKVMQICVSRAKTSQLVLDL